jgi:glycerophosphoryl diester phosphodiesterase
LIELHGGGGRYVRVGHRGAAALEPENTVRSFRRAIELGVDVVELDVLDLADGTLVVAHSDDLREVSHGAAAGRVRPLSLAELRQAAPELPTFDEALELFRSQEVGLHVDVKAHLRAADVAAALRHHGLLDRCVASSFRAQTLAELRAAEPELPVGLTYPEDRHGLARRRVLAPLVVPAIVVLGRALPRRLPRLLAPAHAQVAMLHYGVVSAAAVERCHAAGVAVWAWTVNEPPLLERMLAAGVDGVVSDDPRIFGATLTP